MTKIEVTQDDIDCGKRLTCDKCPVALAIRRVSRFRWNIYSRRAIQRNGPRSVDLPPEVSSFIRDFDNRTPVQPFSFEINLTA